MTLRAIHDFELRCKRLEAALIQELFELGQLGHYPDKLTGVRFTPEFDDQRLLSAFEIIWHEGDDPPYFEIRPRRPRHR